MAGSPGSHTQGRRTLTSFPERRPGEVVKRGRGCQLMISDSISTPACGFGTALVAPSAARWPRWPEWLFPSTIGIWRSWLSTEAEPKACHLEVRPFPVTNGRKRRRPIELRSLQSWGRQHPERFLGPEDGAHHPRNTPVNPVPQAPPRPPCKSSSTPTVQKGPRNRGPGTKGPPTGR